MVGPSGLEPPTTEGLYLAVTFAFPSDLLVPYIKLSAPHLVSSRSMKARGRPHIYSAVRASFALLVGPSGLEPPTSCLSGTRSNLLSYDPMWLAWFSHHSVIFRVKDGRIRPYLFMSALSYLPVQSPVKYFHHCRA